MNLPKFAAKVFAVAALLSCSLARAELVTSYSELADAVAVAITGDMIKIAAGTITMESAITVSEGITLSGGWTTETERTAGAVTTLDGADASDLLTLSNGSGANVTIENIVFSHGQNRGLAKSGVGDLTLRDCRFEQNGVSHVTANFCGRGLYLSGAGAQVRVSGCTFSGNCAKNERMENMSYGGAIYAKELARLTVDDSLFLTNGLPYGYVGQWKGPHFNGLKGAAIFCDGVPLTARDTRFIANRTVIRDATGTRASGAVFLGGASGGSAFTNCLFLANEVTSTDGSSSSYNTLGALVVSLASAGDTVDVYGSTVAYNLAMAATGAAGIAVVKGALTVRNSIVYGNIVSSGCTAGADVALSDGGSADLDWSFLTANDSSSLSGANLTKGTAMLYGDPEFVTPLSTVTALKLTSGNHIYFDPTKLDQLCAIDTRLAAGSPAIDAADLAAAWSREPSGHNGSRRNLGFYGNTSEATASDPVAASVSTVSIAFPSGLSCPNVTVTLADSATPYDATLSVQSGTGDVATAGYAYTNVVYHVLPGASATVSPGAYFKKGDTYHVRVIARVAGCADGTTDASETVQGDLPWWIGHGGGEKVLHVRQNATGAATGADWTDAFPDLKSALAAWTDAKEEIWIAGTIACAQDSSFAPTAPVAIRGGFDGREDRASERQADVVATLDGGGEADLLTLANGSGADVTIERVVFAQAAQRALDKTGAGDLTLSNCSFVANGHAVSTVVDGRGLRASGAGATVSVLGCTFAENRPKNERSENSTVGMAICASSLARLVVDDSLFVSNGILFGYAAQWTGPSFNGVQGAAISATDAPLTARRCRFVSNRATMRDGWSNEGSIVYVKGAGGGSALTNCLFVGNEVMKCDGTATKNVLGTLVVAVSEGAVDVCNATFAGNLVDTSKGSGGVAVKSGTLNLRNSISYGNSVLSTAACGTDLAVYSGATANVAHSLFGTNGAVNVTCEDGGTTNLTATLRADPKFATSVTNVTSIILNAGGRSYFDWNKLDRLFSLNVHLRGRGYRDELTGEDTPRYPRSDESPALDAGDPTATYAMEPAPNGHRLNMGAYGNTPYATKSKGGGIVILAR